MFNERGIAQDISGLVSPQYGRQVKAEPVDVHLHGPVPQAVQDEVSYQGVVAVEGIAAPGVVPVKLLLVIEHVIDAVVDAPE